MSRQAKEAGPRPPDVPYAQLVEGWSGERLVDALQNVHAKYLQQGLRFIAISAHYLNQAGNGLDLWWTDARLDMWALYQEIEHGLIVFDGKPKEQAFRELDDLAAKHQPWRDTFLPVVGPAGKIPRGLVPDLETAIHAARNIYYLELHGWLDPDDHNGLQYGWGVLKAGAQ